MLISTDDEADESNRRESHLGCCDGLVIEGGEEVRNGRRDRLLKVFGKRVSKRDVNASSQQLSVWLELKDKDVVR